MGRSQRVKGAVGEREVVNILKKRGYLDARRVPNSGGLHEKGDIADSIDGFHLEVKRQEVIKILEWCRQSESEAEGRTPLVIFRRSRDKWRVTLPLSDFLDLLERNPPNAKEVNETPCG